MKLELILGDCLEEMKNIPDKSIDMILCDLPFSQTNNTWDVLIPMDKLWDIYNRVCKENGAVVLFANGMFTSQIMQSNPKNWKYNLIWDKQLVSGFLNAKKMPLRQHEDICVFYRKQPTYNPQMTEGEKCHSRGNKRNTKVKDLSNNDSYCYSNYSLVETEGNKKYPTSILTFQKPPPSTAVHPTQKPVALLEYLINTYTNKGDLVLDNCMGSGSTGVACINAGRNFIGIEMNADYFEIAKRRIAFAQKEKNSNLPLEGANDD